MLEALVIRWGYWAVLVGCFFEGEAVLIAGGAFAHRGLLALPWVMLAAFLGSVLGDQLWFQVGRRLGQPFVQRRTAWQARVQRIHAWLDRYGMVFVFGFRFVYGVRSVTPALLGASGYPLRRFLLLNLLGGATWAIAVGAGGWLLGAGLAGLLKRAARFEELLLAAALLALVAGLSWTHVRRRAAPSTLPR